jgi:hypothetical protein
MMMKHILYISIILFSTISCKGQSSNDSIVIPETNTDLKGERIKFTKELSIKYGLTELPFSIIVPKGFEYQFNPKPMSAIRIYKYTGDSLTTEIAIGISAFDKKYSIEQEKVWLEEFKNRPDIINNPDFSIAVYNDYFILNEKRNYYTLMIDNQSEKYPKTTPINSVGLTYPNEEGWYGLAIAVSKWKIDDKIPLTEIEKQIINSITFE